MLDEFRPRDVKEAGQVGAMLEFYFALTSQSGTWAVEDIADWQHGAGLKPRKPIRFRTAPGVGIQAAVKPKSGARRIGDPAALPPAGLVRHVARAYH